MAKAKKIEKKAVKPTKGNLKVVDLKKDNLTKKEKQIAYINGLMILRHLMKQATEVDAKKLMKKFFPRDISLMGNSKQGSYAMDAAGDCPTGIGNSCFKWNTPRGVGAFLDQIEGFIGWQANALLAQSWIINRVCTVGARDAMATGFKLISYDKDGLDVNERRKIHRDLTSRLKFDLIHKCIQATWRKKVFGWTIVIPTFKDSAKVDMSKPFDINKVPKNSWTGMTSIEPFWITYDLDKNDYDASKQAYYEPEYYIIANRLKSIHRSWVIKLINEPISDILRPSYYMGGLPTPQLIMERANCFHRIANEAPLIAMTKRLLLIDADIENLVANPDKAMEMVQYLIQLRDNFGALIKSPDNNVSQIDTQLTDFDMLIQKQAEVVAALGEVKLDQIVSTSNKNANSGGIFQENNYKTILKNIQEYDDRPILEFATMLYLKSELDSTEELGIEFNDIDIPNALDVAKIRGLEATTLGQLRSFGLISEEEGRMYLRQNDSSGFTWLDEELPEPLDLNFGEEETEETKEASSEEKKLAKARKQYKNTGVNQQVKLR